MSASNEILTSSAMRTAEADTPVPEVELGPALSEKGSFVGSRFFAPEEQNVYSPDFLESPAPSGAECKLTMPKHMALRSSAGSVNVQSYKHSAPPEHSQDFHHAQSAFRPMPLEAATQSKRPLLPYSHSNSVTQMLRALLVLAKPEITLMVMISAGVASVMASDSLRVMVLVHIVFGIGLLAAGAAVLNQYLERELDGKMRRTARRPLPANELTTRQALIFGVAVSSAGLLYIFLLLNALTALLGLLTLISYLFIYTPLKTKTSLCTFVGAFPGAAPVLMGWSATTDNLTLEAAALYAILFLWQFPHFYAIGWLYRDDYARAGMLMLPAQEANDGRTTFRLILISTQLLIIASLLMTFIAHTGRLYLVSAIILGICFHHFAYQTSLSRSKLAAKRLLHASVIYLPLLYLFMILDRINR